MARLNKIFTMGLPFDANPLPNLSPENANTYYVTDQQLVGLDAMVWGGINALDTRVDTAELDILALKAADNYFESITAGYSAFFTGEYNFTGTPTNLLVPSFSNVSASQIDYNAGYFNFPYLGTYYAFIELSGDCVNVRADWYQEVAVTLAKTGTDRECCCSRLPPSGTFNMRNNGFIPFNVASGEQWKVRVNMTPNGSTTNGKVSVKIYKKF